MPEESINLYLEAYGWKNFSTILPIEGNIVYPESIVITGFEDQIFEIGESLQLTAELTPKNAEYDSIIWSSSDPSVVSVDENGLMTAISTGSADITSTVVFGSSELSSSIELMVSTASINSVSKEGVYTVYTLQGQLVKAKATVNDLKLLPSGFYIINGKKINL